MRRPRIPTTFAAWVVVASAVFVAAAATDVGGPPGAPPSPAGNTSGLAVGVDEIVDRYNEGVRRTLAGIDSLRVAQTIFEPQEDGSTKRACAILSYGRQRGMVREETFSELVYPVGEYTLPSLVGPLLDRSAYSVEYGGREEAEGVACYRLDVTATTRDYRHFDGSMWVSAENFGPVRIVGKVADPPFPAVEVGLDKVFAEGPHGLRLVRRHRGQGEFRLLFFTKRGERTIFYDDYIIAFAEPIGDDRD